MPRLLSNEPVTGKSKERHRLENKRKRKVKLGSQEPLDYWENHSHTGRFNGPTPKGGSQSYRNKMCPTGLALHYPAAELLLQYATQGCPTNTGKQWTKEQMVAAIERGPHASALEEAPMTQLQAEVKEKVKQQQARVVLWEDINTTPPRN